MIYPSSKSIAICMEIEGQVLREGYVRKGHLRQGDSIYDGDKIIINERGFLSSNELFPGIVVITGKESNDDNSLSCLLYTSPSPRDS